MKKIILYTLLSLAGVLSGCDKFLVEDQRADLNPSYLYTANGFKSSLDAAYGNNRLLWGNQDLFTITVIGTDEFYTGKDGSNNITKYNSSYTASIGQLINVWRACYTGINTCNALIDNASTVADISDDVKNQSVAEAKFLRANYYFVLAQFWGDVTLNKNFLSNPDTNVKRDALSDVYEFIIQDLMDAIGVLPSTTTLPGKATKPAAMHLLAKVYLTRAGSSARLTDDYKNAAATAVDLIGNVAPASGLKLLPNFQDVFAEGNENNSEVLWTVQHTNNLAYNGPNNSGGYDNVLNHMWVPQYELQPGMKRSTEYGRPYIRCVPTRWLTDTLFKERINDTRYAKTFQTVWYSNYDASIPLWTADIVTPGLPPGVNSSLLGKPKFVAGDTAIYMPGVQWTGAKIDKARYKVYCPGSVKSAFYNTKDSKGNVTKITYEGYNTSMSPAMKKYFDTKRADLNYPSIRPVIVYRLAETYLIAAEALFRDGQTGAALPYINGVRERAAYPTGNAAAMDITAGMLTLDFILDERSRELCGENVRWWDLVRTGKLLERVRKHNNECRPNIVEKHILRPIPQAQIDAVTSSDGTASYPQNPGW
jgi:hypothetical protein